MWKRLFVESAESAKVTTVNPLGLHLLNILYCVKRRLDWLFTYIQMMLAKEGYKFSLPISPKKVLSELHFYKIYNKIYKIIFFFLDKDDLISFDEFAKVLERTDVEQKMSIRFLS